MEMLGLFVSSADPMPLWIFERKTIKPKVLMIFTRQLATLIDAGFPLLNGLMILNHQEKDPVLRRVILNVAESIQSGGTLSESLKRHPAIFDELFVNMVRVGEAGGILALTFLQLAEFQEKAHKLRNKIRTAIAYPLMVLLTAIVILCFLLGTIVPKFRSLLPDVLGNQTLPPLTNFVANAGSLFQEQFPGLIVGLFLFSVGLRYAVRTKKGKYLLDNLTLKLPVLGNLRHQYAISCFSRTLGTLIASNVPILQALALTSRMVGNSIIAAAITQIYDSVQAGESLHFPLEASQVFPPMVISMISVGEETGRLSEMLLKIAEIYDDGVESTVASLTSLIEPIIIIFLAFVVGTIVVALFLPLLSITNNFSTL